MRVRIKNRETDIRRKLSVKKAIRKKNLNKCIDGEYGYGNLHQYSKNSVPFKKRREHNGRYKTNAYKRELSYICKLDDYISETEYIM